MIEPVISYLLGNCSCSTVTQYLAFDSDRCYWLTDSLTHKPIHDEAEASWKIEQQSAQMDKYFNMVEDIKINNIPLVQCESYKYLGIHFDNKLNWSTHAQHVCNKVF